MGAPLPDGLSDCFTALSSAKRFRAMAFTTSGAANALLMALSASGGLLGEAPEYPDSNLELRRPPREGVEPPAASSLLWSLLHAGRRLYIFMNVCA